MKSLPLINLISMGHLMLLCLWGGVVAAEAVLELYPRHHPEVHPTTIRFHYWIDLLIELPLVLAVMVTGITLAVLAWPLTALHLLKIVGAAVAVSANLVCIVLVIRRGRGLRQGEPEPALLHLSRRSCARAGGLPFAALAAASASGSPISGCSGQGRHEIFVVKSFCQTRVSCRLDESSHAR